MSDLISRSQLINALKVHFDSCFIEDGELLYSDHICTSDDVVDLIKLVENQPIAYDIDKVVEELNELDVKSITRYKNGNFGNFDGVEYYIKKRKAIEIVKQDFISDDMCEWRLCDEEANVYDTSCRNPHILIEGTPKENNYEYCPYCGKKIKVVE